MYPCTKGVKEIEKWCMVYDVWKSFVCGEMDGKINGRMWKFQNLGMEMGVGGIAERETNKI